MIAMCIFVYLPKWIIFFIAASMFFFHNITDHLLPSHFGKIDWLWHILHAPGVLHIGNFSIHIIYPVIPWIGVMALGYIFAPITQIDQAKRKKIITLLGISLLVGGIILRIINRYGDPIIWQSHQDFTLKILSFLQVTKYPPSLLYLIFTLGPALIFLSYVDGKINNFTKKIIVFGEVPFFFYILHLPVLHLMGILVAYLMRGNAAWLFADLSTRQVPQTPYGYDLLFTYTGWLVCLIMLYPACKWFSNLRKKHKTWWMSYL